MTWAVLQATAEDAAYIAPRMSAADAAECWAIGQQTPLRALEYSMALSIEAWTWVVDGEPTCMYGFAAPSLLGGVATPWMLSTPLVRRHRFTFLRGYRAHIERMLEQYETLTTMVDARHTVCLRWLKWAGFEIGEAEPYGAEGLPFCHVSLARA